MSKLLLFCTLTCLFALCLSNSIVIPDVPGQCFNLGINIRVNESVPAPLGYCYLVRCDMALPQSISTIQCPPFLPAPGCPLGEYDFTKLFPDCCRKSEC